MHEISRTDEIYVGYLPVPARQRRFLRWVVPCTLWLLCGISFLWARSQHGPGAGVWEQAQPAKLRGTLVARPYPMLFVETEGGAPEAVLLVEMGKHGGEHNAAALDGRRVTVTGWPLHRDGRRILELEPGDTSVVVDSGSTETPAAPKPMTRGAITLRGEIVDSKCFLGAMKPGEGKTHKECATLCIRGGIPPMFVTRDSRGRNMYYMLTDPAGGPLDPAAFGLIGDPVEVRGEWAEWSGTKVLRLRPEDIRRL